MLIGNVWLSPPMFDEIAEITGTHRTTVSRWYQKQRLPKAVAMLLDLLQNGNLDAIHQDWAGWRVNASTGELVSPVGTTIKPGEVMSIPYRMHQLSMLQREIKELKSQKIPPVDQVDGPPAISAKRFGKLDSDQ